MPCRPLPFEGTGTGTYESIQKEYKKSTETAESHITREDKNVAERLKLSDRINITAKREAFLTLKDHKPNFRNKPSCRLINPCKPELGKISKQIVEKIVHDVKSKTNLNQWKNTNDVINWFNNIDNKNSHTLICFDICDFYPSISNELLQNAIKFASKYSVITDDQVHIIKHTKKTTLYKDGEPWCKKNFKFRRNNGKLRRRRNLRIGRILPPFAAPIPQHQCRTLPR